MSVSSVLLSKYFADNVTALGAAVRPLVRDWAGARPDGDVGLTAVCASCGQRRRLAFASSCHPRVGECTTVTADLNVVERVCGRVTAQSLATRSDAARTLAAEQRTRAQRGASILRGTLVHFEDGGKAVYVGGEERSEGCYRFRFGEGAGARVERMQPALLERVEQWRVGPCSVEEARALAEEAAPLAS